MTLRLTLLAHAVRTLWPRPRRETPLEEAARTAQALLRARFVT